MLLLPSITTLLWFSGTSRAGQGTEEPFAVADYFELQRVAELALSSDGDLLAYVTQVDSLKEDRAVRRVFTRPLAGDKATLLATVSDGHDIAWIPGTRRLAFLREQGGISQVFMCDPTRETIQQITNSKDPVVRFRFSPNGRDLAYEAQATTSSIPLYNRTREDRRGIVLELAKEPISSNDFLNPDWSRFFPGAGVLWLESGTLAPSRIEIPGDVSDFFWSSASNSLSVKYVADDYPPSNTRKDQTSIGIVDAQNHVFRTLATSYPAIATHPGRRFIGGEWIPGEKKVLIRRITNPRSGEDPWASEYYPDWSVVDVTKSFSEDRAPWHAISASDHATFLPTQQETILVADTFEGTRSVIKWTEHGAEIDETVKGLNGSSSLLTFSSDFSRAVFVNDSLTRPPEIYLWQRERGTAVQLTELNSSLIRKITSKAREVRWSSGDGTIVHGWLLEPTVPGTKGPWPLLTFVHGGPGFAFPNSFAPYFSVWPYPFQVYAEHGIAVFIPNYRGTESYGRTFAGPKRLDGEPVDDIVTGIRNLIVTGIADPQRLGISGHSHGGWLGPLTMTRAKMFGVSSFAEGWANDVVVYELSPLLHNQAVQDVIHGGSLYEAPQHYLDVSPDLHFDGLETANLFEAGAYSNSIQMLGYAKASIRRGLPTEMVIYPKTGHNVGIPSLQKESAERNLDWFRFWLLSEEDPDSAKADQYERWRKLKTDWLKNRDAQPRP